MLDTVEIKQTLWQAIEKLRTKYSLDEIRDCILKLLLFKRVSDLLSEKGQNLSVPIETNWSVLKQEQHQLAQKINEALTLMETANPYLKGVLTDSEIDFWSRFDDKTLRYLIELFVKLDLRGEAPDDLNKFGEISEWLIEKSASHGVNTRGVYTPRQITTMMVKLINPQQKTSIYDPACGSGEFLAESVRFIRESGQDATKVKIHGQSASTQECATAKINLMLHGIEKPDIRLGNAIFEPCFVQDDKLGSFDVVLLNPPFNLKYSQWDLKGIRYPDRFSYGIPSNGVGDFLFIQQAIHSLKDAGKAAIVLPRGVLFRKGDEERIRKEMIEDDWIEAVIELAPKLFYQTSIPVTVVIFNQSKPNKNKILFIDASREYEAGRGQNLLKSEHIDHILSAYHSFQDQEGFTRLVSVKEIADNEYNLSVNRYVIPLVNEQINIALEVERLHQLEAERYELEAKIDDYLQALGIEL
jgi:type I restriction enzyme M protein